MEFVESSTFSKLVSSYLTDKEYRAFQSFLATNPEAGDLIAGTGGFRKVRWSDESRKKGKRGGTRIIYYFFSSDHQLWLLMIYNKDEASDLSPSQKKSLKAAIEIEKKERLESKVKPIWRGTKS
jgi:mRNA-degrading endonuclease RelE of RelBE toxin-antitoxin system